MSSSLPIRVSLSIFHIVRETEFIHICSDCLHYWYCSNYIRTKNIIPAKPGRSRQLLQLFLIYCFQISSFPSQTKTLPCSLVRCIVILFYSIFQFYNQYQAFYKRIKKKIHHRLVIHYKHDSLLPLYTIVF